MKTPNRNLERAKRIVESPLAAYAFALAAATDAPVVVIHIVSEKPVLATVDRETATDFLSGSGMTLPPAGGVAWIVSDHDGPLACGRVLRLASPTAGAA